MNRERKSLSQILSASERENLSRLWNETPAAPAFAPLPAGKYITHVVSGERCKSVEKKNDGYNLCFQVIEGEHIGRRVRRYFWLTEAATPYTKRDLAEIGVKSQEQMDQPLPMGIRCAVQIVLRRGDDGHEYNEVKKFTFIGIDPPVVDPFAPGASPSSQSSPSAAGGAQCQ